MQAVALTSLQLQNALLSCLKFLFLAMNSFSPFRLSELLVHVLRYNFIKIEQRDSPPRASEFALVFSPSSGEKHKVLHKAHLRVLSFVVLAGCEDCRYVLLYNFYETDRRDYLISAQCLAHLWAN